MSIDISDKNIRNREKDFLPPAFSKNGPERAGSHPVELFSRTGRTCYGFQVLIRSKEEDDDDDDEEDDGNIGYLDDISDIIPGVSIDLDN